MILTTVSDITCSMAIEGLLQLVNAREPILDCTFGSGNFWVDSTRYVIGLDKDVQRAKDIRGSFLRMPFRNSTFPTVVYDPPFHPNVGTREAAKFSTLGKNEKELKAYFCRGLTEAYRVSSRHLIVKCQGYIHNHKPQWMPLWAIKLLGEPFEWLIVVRKQKVISSKWVNVNSLMRNHADYLIFDKLGNNR